MSTRTRAAWVDVLVAVATALSAGASALATFVAYNAIGVANEAVFAEVTPVLVPGSEPGQEKRIVPVPVRSAAGTRLEKEEAKVRAIATDENTYAVIYPLRNVGTGVAGLASSAYLLNQCTEPATQEAATPPGTSAGTPRRAAQTVPVGETAQLAFYVTRDDHSEFYEKLAGGGNFCVDFRYTDLLQKQWASIRVNYRGTPERVGWEHVNTYHGEVSGP